MSRDTRERLILAAAELLDRGGEAGVTLRAVAERVGVSHNAPYRHFDDRNALLAAVAERDFHRLTETFRDAQGAPAHALRRAVLKLIEYARAHPARYRLLFSDPDLPASGGAMERAALDAFQAFGKLVEAGQADGTLPSAELRALTGLLYATLHGAIDIELGGRAKAAKGLGSIEATVDLLLTLLRPSANRPAPVGGS